MTPRLQKIMDEMALAHTDKIVPFATESDGHTYYSTTQIEETYLDGAEAGVTERDKELLEKAPEFDPDDLLRPLGLTQVGICEDGREINRKIVRNYFDQLRLKLAALRESDVTCPACCETWSLIDGKQLNEEFHGLHAEAKANWLKLKELREENESNKALVQKHVKQMENEIVRLREGNNNLKYHLSIETEGKNKALAEIKILESKLTAKDELLKELKHILVKAECYCVGEWVCERCQCMDKLTAHLGGGE